MGVRGKELGAAAAAAFDVLLAAAIAVADAAIAVDAAIVAAAAIATAVAAAAVQIFRAQAPPQRQPRTRPVSWSNLLLLLPSFALFAFLAGE